MAFLEKLLLNLKNSENFGFSKNYPCNSLLYYSTQPFKLSHYKLKAKPYFAKPKLVTPPIKQPPRVTKIQIPCFNLNENVSAVLYGRNDIRLENKGVPKHGDTEVLIATECVGVSQADVSLVYEGAYKNYILKHPSVLGHEAAGTVVEIGSLVQKLKPGDRVVVEPIIPCRKCSMCKKGRFNLCRHTYYCGMPPCNGTLSRLFVWPEDYCLKIPHHVDFEEAALLEPLALAHHACKRSGVTVGSKVLISGAGPVGLLNMLCAKACGATNIVITDIKGDRLRCANTMGANSIILVNKKAPKENLIHDIINSLGGKPHVTLECSGSTHAIKVAAEVTKPGGTIMLIGTNNHASATIPIACTMNEVDIRGVLNYCNNYQNALDLIATGRLDLRYMITHDYKLNDIKEAYEVIRSGRAIKTLIHVNPKWIPKRRQSY